MVRVDGPMMSLTARGWFGRYHYGQLGFVASPYPIGLLNKRRVPYSLWDRGIHGTYRLPSFALRPYPGFIFQYYSPKGWCYQMRRTWHGIVWTAMHPHISKQPNTPHQYFFKQRFAYGIHLWQGMSQETKDYYGRLSYPVHPAGYQRFLHFYLLDKPC